MRICHGCRRFHTTAYVAPIPGQLPPDRTNGRLSFQGIGLDFALNNLSLKFLEDDIKFPVLTPNTLEFGEETFNLDEDINMIEGDLREKSKVCQEVQR